MTPIEAAALGVLKAATGSVDYERAQDFWIIPYPAAAPDHCRRIARAAVTAFLEAVGPDVIYPEARALMADLKELAK